MRSDQEELKRMADLFWGIFVADVVPCGSQFTRNPRVVFDAMEAALAKSGVDFVFDITADDDCNVLVLSPEGDKELAKAIDVFIARRPLVPGWKFFGRRQPKPWEDALLLVSNIADGNLSDARFAIWKDEGGVAIDVVATELGNFEEHSANAIAMLLLHHVLGEEFVMNTVRKITGHGEELLDRRYLTPSALSVFLSRMRL